MPKGVREARFFASEESKSGGKAPLHKGSSAVMRPHSGLVLLAEHIPGGHRIFEGGLSIRRTSSAIRCDRASDQADG